MSLISNEGSWVYLGKDNYTQNAIFSFKAGFTLLVEAFDITILSFECVYLTSGHACLNERPLLSINDQSISLNSNWELKQPCKLKKNETISIAYQREVRPPTMEGVPADCDYGYIFVSVKYRVNSNIQNSKFFFKYDKDKPVNLVSVQLSSSLLNILEPSKKQAHQINAKYYTPFPLLALLKSSNEVAEYFNQLRQGLAEEFIFKLNNYINHTLPNNKGRERFEDFTWEELDIVLEAFLYAQQDSSLEISEKHLPLGILNSKSATIKKMKDFFNENNLSLEKLVNKITTPSTELKNKLDTPDIEGVFSEPSDTSDNHLDTPDVDKIF